MSRILSLHIDLMKPIFSFAETLFLFELYTAIISDKTANSDAKFFLEDVIESD